MSARRKPGQKQGRKPPPSLALQGTVWMTADGALLGGRDRIGLLRAIGVHGSITHAAKGADISYKAAWDAVDAMNNLAGYALVERSAGGRGGGGTSLTERGAKLVARYDEVASIHRRFVEQLSDSGADLASDIDLLRTFAMKTSARNHFAGKVAALRKGAVNDEVELEIAGGQRIVAVVTRESSESLALAVGSTAFALVKASSVLIATGLPPAKLSARNQLGGTIAHVEHGAVNDEVVLAVGDGDSGVTIAAIVTSASAKALRLRKGVAATAIFKASSVIVGVPG